MQNVTLIGLRPRAVGNSIENLYGDGTTASGAANVPQQPAKLPCLAGAGGSASTSKIAQQSSGGIGGGSESSSAGRGIRVQQLYDDINTNRHNRGENSDANPPDGQQPKMPTRLPTIAGGSAGDVGGSAPCLKSDSALNNKKASPSMVVPMSPETAMKLYMHKLSPFEQHEIFDYQKVGFDPAASKD